MKKLRIKYGVDPKEAREFPMLAAAYRCPECRNGYKLKRFASDMAKCGGA